MKKKSNYLTDRVLTALKSVLVNDVGAIHEPFFIGKEREYLNSCIDSTYVSSVGAFVGEFESKLTQYTNSKHAIAVVNGTSALHIALKVVGVKPKDEVLVPAMTFIGTANAVSYCGATPHLVEIEEKTFGIDVPKLRHYLKSIVINRNDISINKKTGNIISAIIPMHAYGHPTELDQLKELCNEFHLHMVEDAAESLGSIYKGKHTGTVGDLGIISFNGNKIITTGGGGVILTNDEELASKARHLTTTARIQHEWKMIHDEVGYNY
ncbi:MAG: aminotransferase class I/II-fold pyridoxal phosphate-dependent enzyme, partial [Bacteroidota bacterium]